MTSGPLFTTVSAGSCWTRQQVGGLPEVERDRALHLHLADRCAESDGEWAIYRDEEMAHRFLAQQYEEVVEISTPERLRTAIGDLRAMPNVIDHASLALRASAKTGNKEAFVSLFILLGELHQRTQVLNFEQLASAMVRILPPRIAIDYVVRGGKLQIAASDALRHAAMWATSGQVEVASAVINAVHGLPGILATDSRSNEAIELVENWTEATFGTSGLETVLAQIDRHLPLKHIEAETLSEDDSELWQASSDDDQYQALQCRLAALMRCFDLLLEIRDESNLARVVTILDSEAPEDWRAYVRIERAAEHSEMGSTRRPHSGLTKSFKSTKPCGQPAVSRARRILIVRRHWSELAPTRQPQKKVDCR